MKQNRTRAAAIAIVLLMVLSFSACKKGKGEKFEPSFQAKPYEWEDASFFVPTEWGQLGDPTSSGVLVFAGAEAYTETSGFSNVSVCIYDSDQPAPKIEEAQAAFEANFEAKIKETYPEATGFAYANFQTELYTVLTAEYRYSVMGKELAQKVYYPLVENKQIYVAACDSGSGTVKADDAAHYIVHTLKIAESATPKDGNKEEASTKE